jgi:hypothetical protein
MSRVSDAGRQKIRETIMKTKPWLKSTGPRTPEGKKIANANGRRKSPELKQLEETMKAMRKAQRERSKKLDEMLLDAAQFIID